MKPKIESESKYYGELSKLINILYSEDLNILPCISIVLSVVLFVIEVVMQVVAFENNPGEERRKQKRIVMEKIRRTKVLRNLKKRVRVWH